MDYKTIEALQERTRRLQQELDALSQEAGDFPAVVRNAQRMRASLAMIALAVGGPEPRQLDADGADLSST